MNTTHRPSRLKTVLIAMFIPGMTGWEKRSGVFRYIGEGKPWNVQIATTAEELRGAWERRHQLDGILLSAPNIDADLCGFARTNVPIVIFNLNIPASSSIFSRQTGVVFLHHDSSAIGTAAAQHLLSSGVLKSFVFLAPSEDVSWSNQREAAFANVLSRCGYSYTRLTATQEHAATVRTLQSLPKPIGLFAASDKIALLAMAIGRESGLRVPHDLAILGVDNDESICESTIPSLSSIATTPEALGYAAAQLLDQLMARPSRPTRDVTLKCRPNVTIRESTLGSTPHGPLVEKASSYIEAHATEGIGPNDVAKHLGISRRLLDLRFAQVRQRTVLSTIQDAKLENVQKQLLNATATIEEITRACGYASPNHLKKVFKSRFGMSMRQWRQQHVPAVS